MPVQIIAHRGASAHAPENTLEAFRLAATLGADGIELDVRLGASGLARVVHDPIESESGLPILDMVFEEVGALFSVIHVELKEAGLLPEVVLACIERHQVAGRVLLSSFLPEALVPLREKNLPCGLLFARPTPEAAHWDILNPHFSLIDATFLKSWPGKRIHAWTVNAPEEIRRLDALGVSSIITDDPALARAALEG
jgi:glycerophosphoryl diester phosphodiesterase